MQRFWKKTIADIILCTCLTVSMVFALCSGFELAITLPENVLAVSVISFVLAALFCALAQTRRTILMGIFAGLLLSVLFIAFIRSHAVLGDEVARSTAIFVCVQLLSALAVFLLSRSRAGAIALFIVGTIICAGASFLQFPIPIYSFILFLAAATLMFLYRVYTAALANAELGYISTPAYLRQTALLCAAALLLAGGFFLAVISPANLPTQELKLITVLNSMDTLEVLGVSSTRIILDAEQESGQIPDELEQSRQQGEAPPEPQDFQQETVAGQNLYPDISSSLQQQVAAIRYSGDLLIWLWLLPLIPLAVIGAYMWSLASRKRWHKQVQALSKENAVLNYYRFFLKGFELIGIKKPENCTLREFAQNSEFQLQPFVEEGGAFDDLTNVYEQVLYGRLIVSDGDYLRFEKFYDGFYAVLRKELGPLKYYLRAFRY